LLALARLRGRFPRHITLIGVQPLVLDDLGGSLSAPVRARLDEAVALARAELAGWGVQGKPRGDTPAEALSPAALAIQRYEDERPSAAAACRIGDARFLGRAVHSGST
jgi:hydrogenase maturation protease